MRRYLTTLEDDKTPRSTEEYLGAFTESLKVILHQNPVERMGHAVLLAAKTALRLKAANPKLKEYEIANSLQKIARSIRLTTILDDLTPEEKVILNLHPDMQNKAGLDEMERSRKIAVSGKTKKKTAKKSIKKKVSKKRRA